MCRIIPYQSIHRDGIVAVVQDVHREYSFTWEADGYHRDLYHVEEEYLGKGGMFWSLLDADRVIGCVGVTFHDSNSPAHDPQEAAPLLRNPNLRSAELHRLYLLSTHRGHGWGKRMLDISIDHSRRNGCTRMIAWSDVVLKDAHGLYLKSGFVQEGTRICNDPDKCRELGFWKEPL